MELLEMKNFIQGDVMNKYRKKGLSGTESIAVNYLFDYDDYCTFTYIELGFCFNFDISKTVDNKYLITVTYSEIPDTHIYDLLNKKFLTYEELDIINDWYDVEDCGLSGEYPNKHFWTVWTPISSYEVYTD